MAVGCVGPMKTRTGSCSATRVMQNITCTVWSIRCTRCPQVSALASRVMVASFCTFATNLRLKFKPSNFSDLSAFCLFVIHGGKWWSEASLHGVFACCAHAGKIHLGGGCLVTRSAGSELFYSYLAPPQLSHACAQRHCGTRRSYFCCRAMGHFGFIHFCLLSLCIVYLH
jgi:hypothetical protein